MAKRSTSRPQECSITTRPPLNPLLNGNLNSFLRMKRVFSLLLNIGQPGGRRQVPEPFSTKMSPRSCPGPGGWRLPVVRLSLMHRLLSKHCNPAVSYSVATSERTHCAVAHCCGVLSPLAHSVHGPSPSQGPGQGSRASDRPWCVNPGSCWELLVGAVLVFTFWTPLTEHFPSRKKKDLN